MHYAPCCNAIRFGRDRILRSLWPRKRTPGLDGPHFNTKIFRNALRSVEVTLLETGCAPSNLLLQCCSDGLVLFHHIQEGPPHYCGFSQYLLLLRLSGDSGAVDLATAD